MTKQTKQDQAHIAVTLRVRQDLIKEIRRYAADDVRTLNSYMQHLMLKEIRAKERKNEKAA